MNYPTLAIRHGEIWSDARLDERTPQQRYVAEAPYAGVRDYRLMHFLREAGEIEKCALPQLFVDRDADVFTASSLRL